MLCHNEVRKVMNKMCVEISAVRSTLNTGGALKRAPSEGGSSGTSASAAATFIIERIT